MKNKTLSLSKIVKTIKKYHNINFELHIMAVNPLQIIRKYGEYFSKITFHIDNLGREEISDALKLIREKKKKAGIALLHTTPLTRLAEADKRFFQSILLLCIRKPGFSGQRFAPNAIEKIRKAKVFFKSKAIEVDGGVTPENISIIAKAGADIIDCASAIYSADDIKKRIGQLIKEVSKA